MKEMRVGLLCCVAIFCAGCLTSRDSPVGRTYYTKANIWYSDPREIPTTNYHDGRIIPFGSKVTIHELNKNAIGFSTEKGSFRIVRISKHMTVSMQTYFDQNFGVSDPKGVGGPYERFSALEKAAVDSGTISDGMSKESVLAAYGYPPSHKTPDLGAGEWRYWVNRRKSVVVPFQNGQAHLGSNATRKSDSRGTIQIGDTQERVSGLVGQPNVAFSDGDCETCFYRRGTVSYRNGRVISLEMRDDNGKKAQVGASDLDGQTDRRVVFGRVIAAVQRVQNIVGPVPGNASFTPSSTSRGVSPLNPLFSATPSYSRSMDVYRSNTESPNMYQRATRRPYDDTPSPNRLFYSDGSSAWRSGNTTYYSDGTMGRQIGNATYFSDGTTARQTGNAIFYSNGTTARRIGNATFYSDGSTERQIGNQVFISE
jgi:hypothetical protein